MDSCPFLLSPLVAGRAQLLLEIEILHSSDHPKLVRLYDVFETRAEMILILEL